YSELNEEEKKLLIETVKLEQQHRSITDSVEKQKNLKEELKSIEDQINNLLQIRSTLSSDAKKQIDQIITTKRRELNQTRDLLNLQKNTTKEIKLQLDLWKTYVSTIDTYGLRI